ncbi:MAG TPA: D-alanyl-D-alanine carboxypeptidase/D-alanyl-D-alanine-endopeptidase [Gemmataceae bacterium]|nr:D-alanyl-D-alanine carboxypeptidase/D-alanyl-D-alanine-endopeptidase [Gemmataceae bacterium]
MFSPRRTALVIVCLFAGLLVPAARGGDSIDGKVASVIDGPDYKQARWGVLVVDAKTGDVIYERNAERLFMPASVTKLYSCAAALAAFGADYKFETPVYRRGDLRDGRLRGDLILVARGDLTLGGRTTAGGKMAFKDHDHIYANFPSGSESEVTDTDPLAGLTALARQVKEAGVKRIDGDVLIDDRLFAKARGSGSGPDLLTPIAVNDNVIDVLITPADRAGDPAVVKMRPQTSLIQMDAQVATGAEKGKPRLEIEAVGPNRFTVRGQVPVKSQPLVRIYPVDDPSAFARALFIEALRREGLTVSASPLAPPEGELPERDGYDKLTRVAVYVSPPFSEFIKVTLKVSHNLYASTLPLLVASKEGKRTLPDGLALQRKFLKGLGVPVETISFGGGAGGAIADNVTPRATVALLQAMRKRDDWPAYRAALPVLGVDGTLVDVAPSGSRAKGKVMAKTGTLVYGDLMNERQLLRSKAMAGVMTTDRGRELTFAMFVNDVPLPRGVMSTREGKVLGKLAEIIQQNAD